MIWDPEVAEQFSNTFKDVWALEFKNEIEKTKQFGEDNTYPIICRKSPPEESDVIEFLTTI